MISVSMTPKSLERKLILLIFSVVLTALVLLGSVIYRHQLSMYRTALENNLYLIGETVAENMVVALRFDVPKDAEGILSSLRHVPRIQTARLHLPDGELFAEYLRSQTSDEQGYDLEETLTFRAKDVLRVKKIIHDGDLLGFLVISHDLDGLKIQSRETLTIILAVLLSSLFLAEGLGVFFLRKVTRPVRHLIDVSMLISETGDLSVRAEKTTDDDLGLLVRRYNQMLEQLQQNALELKHEKEALDESRDRERSLQEQLSRSERMESLGLLAGGVAHDLNNILGPLVGYPDIILDEMEEGAKHRHEIEQIQMAAGKAAAVIQDLLTLARRGSYRLQPVNLNDIVRDYQKSITFKQFLDQHPGITCRCDLAQTEPALMGSEHHLTQVLMNLTYNAAEATQDGGEVFIQTQSVELEDTVEGLEMIPPGRYVVLTVQDQGSGIPEEVKVHIFEPFYSRKELGTSGSGLGLSVVYGIVKDLDGYIDLSSKESKGTVFNLYFPMTDQRQKPEEQTGTGTGGKESVLVVDDLPIQRELATKILESLGYSAQTAESGRESIRMLKEQSFDVVLLDMIMEDDFDGLETFRGLKEIDPDITCIIVSGFSESDRVKQAEQEGVKAFLSKPYTRKELQQAIQGVLDVKP